jgi:hypothetical protein
MTGTAQDLAAAVKALVPSSVVVGGTTAAVDRYDTELGLDLPPNLYYVVNVRVPNVAERSESGQPVSVLCKVAITIGARTALAVRDLASAAILALDSARPTAAGWETGPLQLRNTRGPDRDQDVTFTNGAHVIYGLLEFDLAASRLP